jgi:hypothetical protein
VQLLALALAPPQVLLLALALPHLVWNRVPLLAPRPLPARATPLAQVKVLCRASRRLRRSRRVKGPALPQVLVSRQVPSLVPYPVPDRAPIRVSGPVRHLTQFPAYFSARSMCLPE